MNLMRHTALLLLASAAAVVGCRANEEIGIRYGLEKKLWKAEAIERRLDITVAGSSEREIEAAMQAYREIALYDVLRWFDGGAWNSSAVRDIRMLVAQANIAQASLAFLADRYVQPGIYFRSTIDDPIMYIDDNFRSKERLARLLYSGNSCERLDMESERFFRQLAGSDDFWSGSFVLKDALLSIPLVLLQMCDARNDPGRYAEYDDMAETFYTRIIRVWPDSIAAEQARLHMVFLLTIRADWSDALEAIDDMLDHQYGRNIAPRLMILKAYALAKGLNDPEAAVDVLVQVARLYPESEGAYAADLARGFIYMQAGDAERGLQLFLDIEKNERASEDVRSKAMLLRAVQLERQDTWNESMLILKRLMRFYPATPAALEAPLVVTRHYVSAGDTAHAATNLGRARAFYESLIERRNTLFERGYIVEDYLIENYILADRTEEIVRILSEESDSWGWSRSASALLKGARLCANVLHDTERSSELLKLCMRRFPETRYSRAAERDLAMIDSDGGYRIPRTVGASRK